MSTHKKKGSLEGLSSDAIALTSIGQACMCCGEGRNRLVTNPSISLGLEVNELCGLESLGFVDAATYEFEGRHERLLGAPGPVACQVSNCIPLEGDSTLEKSIPPKQNRDNQAVRVSTGSLGIVDPNRRMDRQATMNQKPNQLQEQIIRVSFVSGRRTETRGTEEQVAALFNGDDNGLVDYVQTMDPVTGEHAVWCRDEDQRFEDSSDA